MYKGDRFQRNYVDESMGTITRKSGLQYQLALREILELKFQALAFHQSKIGSDAGLTLEMLAFEFLYSSQFTLQNCSSTKFLWVHWQFQGFKFKHYTQIHLPWLVYSLEDQLGHRMVCMDSSQKSGQSCHLYLWSYFKFEQKRVKSTVALQAYNLG